MVNFNYLKNVAIWDIACSNNGNKLKGSCSRVLVVFTCSRIPIAHNLTLFCRVDSLLNIAAQLDCEFLQGNFIQEFTFLLQVCSHRS